MFSLLSRGYGTYDGKAKKDTQETREHKEYFSLEDLHLPPIRSNYQALAQKDIGEYDSGPRYENKPFKLPKVEDMKHSIRNVPKTYTTRKGALLLYAEDFFLPGSPKPRKRRQKYKKQQTMKLKTIGDLRNYILDYRNGGDPLFLALLEKRMSGHKDQSVRPGFSPKRYIATLGNSLEEDTWNRLAATGSFKDPSLLTYIPQRTPEHGEAVCSLFSGKPQPYSTMSLPPISPSSSMLESSFHFYKNGMSTGAASMISLNSETEEYAPSSRALSPAESLNDRLSEVEFLPQRKDPYSQLNSTQKENLLSQLLLQRTLESMNSDLSDLQGWVTNYPESGGGMEKDPVSVVTISKSKAKHRGSLKSGSSSSIPRLPPIQSAGARPSTPVELKEESPLPQISMEQSIHQQPDITTEKDETDNILDPSSVHLHLSSILVDENIPFVDQGDLQGRSQGDGDTVSYSKETTADIEDDMKQEDQSENASQSVIMGKSSEESDRPGIQRRPNKWKENSGCENSVEDQVMIKSDDMIALDDIVLSEDTTYDDKRQSTQGEEIKHKQTLENVDQMEERSEDDSQPQVQKIDMAELDHTHTKADDEDEGIGIDEGVVDMSEKMGVADDNLAITEEGIQTSQENTSLPPAEPPPPISLEELQGEARTVASKVLSRPQSGMVFMEDIKAAIAMWADRLTNLLGPPRQAERVSSANHQRQHSTHLAAKEGLVRHARHRKMSRSAGPSPAALREALRISGGEVMEIEVLKNLPPLPKRLSKTSQSQPPGLDTSVHKFYEKHGSASTKRSGSSNAAQSIPWERVSNADVQVDVFSYATKDEEPSFHRVQFDEIDDDESDDEDEEFKTALDAVVTEVKQDYTLIEARSRVETSSPKKEQKPFQFPRPAESKPPAGLQNKQTQGQVKGKAKSVPAKKKPVVKKRAGKKSTKEPSKASNKTSKTGKGKGETQKKNHQEKQENISDVKAAEGEKTDPLRVDSETGEHEPATSQRTVVSSALSGVTSSRVSSKASDGLSEKKTADSPSERHDTPVVEVPFLAPKPTEPQIIQPEPEPEVERTPEPEEQKPSQESRAARRAAERAAAAERRRQEVERKRREREEAKKRAAEEETRLQQLRLEAEEEMKKREEELRRKREEKEEEKRRKQEEEMEQERLASIKIERERRAKEDWKKRQQQVLAQRKLEEELRKEQEKIEAELEAARLREEEERIKAMEESDRIAFLEKMRQEEEELRRRLEEQRRKEERERKLREEERKQREDALALLRQKQLQRHLFIAGILKESHYLSLSQRLTKAFTFSYFDLIPWNHLQHLKPPPSPVRDLLHSVRENIPPTILEEDEVTED